MKKLLVYLMAFVLTFSSVGVGATGVGVVVAGGTVVDLLVSLAVSYTIFEGGKDLVRNKSLVGMSGKELENYLSEQGVTTGQQYELQRFIDECVRCWQTGVDSISMSLDRFLNMGLDNIVKDVYTSATALEGGISEELFRNMGGHNINDYPFYTMSADTGFPIIYFYHKTLVIEEGVDSTVLRGKFLSFAGSPHNGPYTLRSAHDGSQTVNASFVKYSNIKELLKYGTTFAPSHQLGGVTVDKDVPVPYAMPNTMINTGVFRDYVGVGDVSDEETRVPVVPDIRDWRETLEKDGLLTGDTVGDGSIDGTYDDVLGGIGVVGKILNGIKSLIQSITNLLTNVWNWLTGAPTVQLNLAPLEVPNLIEKFPFCLPFDLVRAIDGFIARPAPPKWTFDFGETPLSGGEGISLDIDLTDWNMAATLCRYFIGLIYTVGLIKLTRNIAQG